MEQKIHNEICLTWVNELSINQKKEEISGSSCAFDLTWLKIKGSILMSTDPVCYWFEFSKEHQGLGLLRIRVREEGGG